MTYEEYLDLKCSVDAVKSFLPVITNSRDLTRDEWITTSKGRRWISNDDMYGFMGDIETILNSMPDIMRILDKKFENE